MHRTSFAAVATASGAPGLGCLLRAYRAPEAGAEKMMDHACTAAGHYGA